ncbi:hypothetical protein HPB48_026328 [Haemaphysalis longicornis]|uniref:Uncharacterized protein n=1 Tax=Haemaphysalis longicornis TaxID=44386 RepID=A0A9J6HAH9_HAELO|nr:hypothetical protein HPB48_026328 [Haemaphysalis longicornis]
MHKVPLDRNAFMSRSFNSPVGNQKSQRSECVACRVRPYGGWVGGKRQAHVPSLVPRVDQDQVHRVGPLGDRLPRAAAHAQRKADKHDSVLVATQSGVDPEGAVSHEEAVAPQDHFLSDIPEVVVDYCFLRQGHSAPRTLHFSQTALFEEVLAELGQRTNQGAAVRRIRTTDSQFFDAGPAGVDGLHHFTDERAVVHRTDALSLGDLFVARRAEHVAARKLIRKRRHHAADRTHELIGNFVDKLQRPPVQELVEARQLSSGGAH